MTLSENSDGEGWMSDRRSGVPRRRRREVRHDIPSAGAPLPLPRGLGAGPGGGLGRGAPRPREAAREPLGKRDRRPGDAFGFGWPQEPTERLVGCGASLAYCIWTRL